MARIGPSPVTQYRDHRRLLADSMETLVEVNSRAELIAHLQKLWPFPDERTLAELTIKPYRMERDHRIGWDQTYIVHLPELGVLGFTDGPLA